MRNAMILGEHEWKNELFSDDVKKKYVNMIVSVEPVLCENKVVLFVRQNMCFDYLYDLEKEMYMRVSNTGIVMTKHETLKLKGLQDYHFRTDMSHEEKQLLDEWLKRLVV